MADDDLLPYALTDDPDAPCAYCVAWNEAGVPTRTDGTVVAELRRTPHPRCSEMVAAYIDEQRDGA